MIGDVLNNFVNNVNNVNNLLIIYKGIIFCLCVVEYINVIVLL